MLYVGAFGVVHKGELKTSDGALNTVAIKTIKCELFCVCVCACACVRVHVCVCVHAHIRMHKGVIGFMQCNYGMIECIALCTWYALLADIKLGYKHIHTYLQGYVYVRPIYMRVNILCKSC